MRLIAFNGKMFSGKSSVTDLLVGSAGSEVINMKFAQPLYDMQSYIYTRAKLPQPRPKDRKLLQWLGTEWGRDKDPELWANIWQDDVLSVLKETSAIITCDDCRFDNEAKMVKKMGGIVVQVTASEEVRRSRAAALGMQLVEHASEAGVSPEFVDEVLDNSGSMNSLAQQVEALMKKYGL